MILHNIEFTSNAFEKFGLKPQKAVCCFQLSFKTITLLHHNLQLDIGHPHKQTRQS